MKKYVKQYKILLQDGPANHSPVGSSVYDSMKEGDVLIGIIMEYDPNSRQALIELINALPEDRVIRAGGLPVKYT